VCVLTALSAFDRDSTTLIAVAGVIAVIISDPDDRVRDEPADQEEQDGEDDDEVGSITHPASATRS